MMWVAVVSIPALWIGIRFSLSLGNSVHYTGTVGIVSGIVKSSVGVRIVAMGVTSVTISMRIVVRIGDYLGSFSLLYFCCLLDFLLNLWRGVNIGVMAISICSICSQSVTVIVRVWVVSGVVIIKPWIGFGFGFRLCYCESKKSENYNLK